jgi:mxaJ protein
MRTLIALALIGIAPLASAHSGNHRDAGEWFLIALLGVFGAWYGIGFARVYAHSRSGRAALVRHALLFVSGWTVIALSLLTPLHALGGRSFTAHMIEHELLMLLAAPLLAWSKPIGVLLWALPARARHATGTIAQKRWYATAWSSISAPLAASLLQAAAMWAWHAPSLFNRALVSEGWHAAQHLSFVASATLFWWSMDLAARERRAGVAAFWLFFTSVHSGLLGALMTFAQSPWYPRYVELGLQGLGGMTPLEDQQLAGVIMWIPGGLVHAIVALIYLGKWLRVPRAALPLLVIAVSTTMLPAEHARAEERTAARELRVCADPNNLPFSNSAQEGFENRLVDLIAHDLDAVVSYEWHAQRRGNVRETLNERRCDVIPGIGSQLEMLATTQPYYRSSYVFVTRAQRSLEFSGFDDERLRQLLIGVQMIGDDFSNTPPAHSLARRGIVDNVRGYMVYGDYQQTTPARSIIDAVVSGEIDVAIVWGPIAGYFAGRGQAALVLQPVSPKLDGPMLPMQFDVSLGVRKDDEALRLALDKILEHRRTEIRQLLLDYRVPLIEE